MRRGGRKLTCQRCLCRFSAHDTRGGTGEVIKGEMREGAIRQLGDRNGAVVTRANNEIGNEDEDHAIELREEQNLQQNARVDNNNENNSEENLNIENEDPSADEDDGMEVRRRVRIGAWNVGGLFEKLSRNGVSDYINSFDIACLGETFTLSSFDFNIKFGDFKALHNPAKKINIRGRPSGGLVILIRKTLERFITIIETKINHVLCFKISKELLNTCKDILFIGTYVHPADSVFYLDEDHSCTLEAVEQFMLDELEEGEECNYIIAGDLNARISDWELKLGNVEEDEDEGELESINRSSKDSVTNENGHKLIQICTAFNATPVNGIHSKNFDDNFTFIGRRGNSTIDHFVCSADLMGKMENYRTRNRVESDHMPIELELTSGGGDR